MRNLEFCDRCLPEKSILAMGFIPLPEMTNIGDTRDNERKILLCRTHYFEDKEKCFYVVPFDRDDDPVDNFLTRVKRKHNRIRGWEKPKRLEIKEREEPLDPIILEDFPKPRRIRNAVRKGVPKNIGFRKEVVFSEKPKLLSRNGNSSSSKRKVHYVENGKTLCGYSSNTLPTNDVESLTCKVCLDIVKSLQQATKV